MRYILVLLLLAAVLSAAQGGRDVFALSKWAAQKGIVMHESLEGKQYGPDDDNNWGLPLTEPVPPGTTLVQVPQNVVF